MKFRQPIRLVRQNLHGMLITGPSGQATIAMSDLAASINRMSPTEAVNAEHGIEPRYQALSGRAKHYAMAKYLSDKSGIEEALMNAWLIAVEVAMQHGWRAKEHAGKEVWRYTSRIALAGHVDPALWPCCPHCRGSGKQSPDLACKNCRGKGRRHLTHVELARHLDLSPQDYDRVWRPRVDAIERALASLDREVLHHLYCQAIGICSESVEESDENKTA